MAILLSSTIVMLRHSPFYPVGSVRGSCGIVAEASHFAHSELASHCRTRFLSQAAELMHIKLCINQLKQNFTLVIICLMMVGRCLVSLYQLLSLELQILMGYGIRWDKGCISCWQASLSFVPLGLVSFVLHVYLRIMGEN
jgi:hypothetical protein